MGFLKEFKEFSVKGNVMDLAVGVIIGGAFGKIVSSLVADVIMPPLGFLIGGVDFTGFKVVLKEAVPPATEVALNYGKFLQSLFDFTIVAFAIFLVVKGLNAIRRKQEAAAAAPAAPSNQELLLAEIRDLLKKKTP